MRECKREIACVYERRESTCARRVSISLQYPCNDIDNDSQCLEVTLRKQVVTSFTKRYKDEQFQI